MGRPKSTQNAGTWFPENAVAAVPGAEIGAEIGEIGEWGMTSTGRVASD